MFKNRVVFAILVFSAALIFHSSTGSAQSYTIKNIQTNDTGFTTKLKFMNPSPTSNGSLFLNNKGEFVFITNGRLMLYSKGNIKSLANTVQTGFTNKNRYLEISSSNINDNGTVIFTGGVMVDIETIKVAIFKVMGNEVTSIVSSGDAVQGLESTIEDSHSPSLNNNGEIAFNATLSDSRSGLFLLTDEGIQSIILESDPFPVFTGDETLVFADLPVINDKGEIVFLARFLKDAGSPENLDNRASGVFLYSEGEIVPVKLPGIEAPGTNGMVFWDEHTSGMTLGNNSEVVFRGEYMIPGGDENTLSDRKGSGLFLWFGGSTFPLILTGNETPGIDTRFLFSRGNLIKNTINDLGEIAVSFATGSLGGLFLLSSDEVNPVILSKNGNPDSKKIILFTYTAAINNRGDIVFFGTDITGREGVFLATKEE